MKLSFSQVAVAGVAILLSGCVSSAPGDANATAGTTNDAMGQYPAAYLMTSYPYVGDWALAPEEYQEAFEMDSNPDEKDGQDFCLGEDKEGPCPEVMWLALLHNEESGGMFGISFAGRFAAGELTTDWLDWLCGQVDGEATIASHGDILVMTSRNGEEPDGKADWGTMTDTLLAKSKATKAC